MTDDELLFADEADTPPGEHAGDGARWPVLIVDDEPEVHSVTRLAVEDFVFMGRTLECISAHSAAEARRILGERDDIAVILLDVVMEHEHAGLELTRFIRDQLGNRLARIILRTGHPGQAPPLDVVTEYDINHYEEKSQLTAEKLLTSLYAALRAYRHLEAIESNRRGLEKVVEASAEIFAERSLARFARGVLEQFTALLFPGPAAADSAGIAVARAGSRPQVIAATGDYAGGRAPADWDTVPETVRARIEAVFAAGGNVFGEDHFAGYFNPSGNADYVLYIAGDAPVAGPEYNLVELFARNVAVAADNLLLNRELDRSQQELVYVLCEAIEKRSRETGNHVRRVGEYAGLLARDAGLPEREARLLALAAPLHDVGKIGVPDSILNKPGRYDQNERNIMSAHAEIGRAMLEGYDRPLLSVAAIVAGQHHERWDGQGYPDRLAGEDIHIYGRITAIADVFDALVSERAYKPAWPLEDVVVYMRENAGKQFDPELTDLFLRRLDDIRTIRERFPD